ncbi:hypothetical protein GT043_36640 [Streptomyces sp. SID2131]|nr:hypothetical protein [Streptomyces sp. SID2131]
MSRQHIRLNRFGFAEYSDMNEIALAVDVDELAEVLGLIVELVFSEDSGLLDSLTDDAQSDFVVPLGMAAKMLEDGKYSTIELVSAACTVRYCAERHLSDFPGDLVQLLTRLPL